MRKALPYILGSVIIIAALLLVFTGSRGANRELDERLSFRKRDKIPYGAFVAYEGLKYLFPQASISASRKEPGYWDSLSNYKNGQALIIVSPVFNADEFEMRKLISFVENGNDVFISAAILSDDAKSSLACAISYLDIYEFFSKKTAEEDTLRVALSDPPFTGRTDYMYPGKRYDCYFYRMDTTISTVMGTGHGGNANFIHLKAGLGNMYVHLAPMAFTNYFLLHEKNMGYYQDMLSVISPETKKVVWDEYYLEKRLSSRERQDDGAQGWLSTLFKHKGLRWAMLTAIFTLLAYVLLEMRRKQRAIPFVSKPRNDSLDFVKTIGRLYFDKGDHKNLCRKMAAYFLEHVRNRYKLPTALMNEDLVKGLQYKTGADEKIIRNIVFFIRDIDRAGSISDQQLAYFHKQLESFYSQT